MDTNLTTAWSGHVAGSYFHPNPDFVAPEATPYNCIVLDVLASDTRHLNVTAQWAGGEKLVMFHWLRDYGEPTRDHQQVTSNSPATQQAEFKPNDRANWLFIGIQPPPDLPAGFDLQGTPASLHIEVTYVGDAAPYFHAFRACTYDFQ